MNETKPQSLLKYARALETQMAATKLINCLFNQSENTDVTPGRYRFLEKAIEESPAILKTLLNESAESKESCVLPQPVTADARFFHGLAVMYLDQAIATLNRKQPDGHLWYVTTRLWLHLLCSEDFWEYFSEDRFATQENTMRQHLKSQQQEALFNEAWQSIFQLHDKSLRHHFAAGQHEQAQVHLRCIDICRRERQAANTKSYSVEGISCNLTQDKGKLRCVESLAETILDDWASALVKDAEKTTENAEAIRNLPKGIRKNYAGGIQCLEKAINLGVPIARVLRTSLQWYNDWCYDLYITKNLEQIKEQMRYARLVADKLAPLCLKGRGFCPENQALSQHFLFRGFITDTRNPDDAVKEYEEALAWNPGNENAKTLLGDTAKQIFMQQIENALKCMERGQFREADEVLNSVEQHLPEQVREARAVVYFNHAQALVTECRFREALSKARESQKLNPSHPVIQRLVKEIEELLPEESNLKHLHEAKAEFKKEHYSNVIEELSYVPKNSMFYKGALSLKSAAYFYRGVAEANKMNFRKAVEDLEYALEINEKEEERKIIRSQLDALRQGNIGYELKQAMENRNWYEAARILRKAISDNPPSEIKHQLESQLSLVLNAQAVDIANEAAEEMKELAEAAQEIRQGYGYRHGYWSQRDLVEKLESINNKKRNAIKILEEAVKYDRHNEVAKQNLDMLKKSLK